MPGWICRRARGGAPSQCVRFTVLSRQDLRRQVCHRHSVARRQRPVRWALDVVLGVGLGAARPGDLRLDLRFQTAPPFENSTALSVAASGTNMDNPTKDRIIASLALGAVVASLYFGFGGRSPKLNLDPYDVLGAVTAEETAKLLAEKGLVLVMARGTGADKNPSVEAELKAFQQTLKKHSGLRLVTERVEVTPMLMMATGGGVPPDQLFKALQTHTNVGALVLFFGFPPLADPELEALAKSSVKIVVVSSFHPDYKRLLERRAIHLAIVPRSEA